MADNGESVVFKVEIDNSDVEKGMNEAKKKVKKIADETADAQKKAQNSVSINATENNERSVESSERSHKKVKLSSEETAEARQRAQNSTADNAEQNDKKIVDSAEKAHRQTRASAKQAAEEIADTVSRHGDYIVNKNKEDTEKLKKNQEEYEAKAKKTADNVKKFYLAAGAAILAETAASIKAAANYQTSYAKVFTLTEDGTDESAYANEIKQASRNTGVNVSDMSEAVYSAISASIDQSSAVSFTENAVKLAKGGFTETATAVDVLTTAINAYGLAADDATHVSDVLVTTQNLGKTTVDELAHSMGQVIPIANGAGESLESLSTDYAILTKNGIATAESGTMLKAMFNELGAAGSIVDKTLRELSGKSFAELKNEGQTTADVLNTLNDYAQSSGKTLKDLFGSVEAGTAAITLVKDGGADFASVLDQMQNSAGAADAAYEKMSNTIEAKAEKLLNKITIMFAEAGEKMLPMIDDLIQYVDDNADEIEEIIVGIGDAVRNVMKVAGDLLKIMWEHKEATAALAAAFIAYKTAMAISSVIDKFKASTEGATIAQKLLNVAMSSNPVVLIITGLAALTAGLIAFASGVKSTTQQVKELSDSAKELSGKADEYSEKADSLDKIKRKYEEIENSELGAETKAAELKAIQDDLIAQYGDQASGIDLVNGKYQDQIDLMDGLIERNRDLALANVNESLAKARTADSKNISLLDFKLNDLESQDLNKIFKWIKYGNNLSTFDTEWNLLRGTSEERAADLQKLYDYANSEFGEKRTAKQQKFMDRLVEMWTTQDDNANLLNSLTDQYDRITGKVALDLAKKGEALNQEQMQSLVTLYPELADKIEETTAGYIVETEAVKELELSQKKAAEAVNESSDAYNKTAESTNTLTSSAKDLIDKYGDLYKALENVKNGGALSYEQMQDLITLYPELASKVELTADGYIIEANALADLETALDNTVDSQIQAERDRTQAALDGARERAEIYRSELALMYGHASQAEMDKKQEAYYSVLEEIEAKQARLNELDAMGAVSAYLKGSRGSSVNSGGSVGGSGRASSGSGVNENEQTYDKEYATLKYRHDMGEISDAEFYSGIGELRDQYLEADSDKWRAANVSIHNWEESQKKSSGSSSENSSGKSGNNISITSYIPTVWDSEDEANRKMQQALGIELAGNSKYGHIMSGIERSAAVSQMSAVSSGADSTAREATLSDVVTAINELQKADENRQISFDVTLKARDLVVGRIAVADINDITKIDGKSPLILK